VERIVHICEISAWEAALPIGEYRPPSLEREGFIHASQAGQVLDVANRFYRGAPRLALLWIDPHRVQADLRWEAVEGEVYPHIYAPLRVEDVIAVTDFVANEDGIFSFLPIPQD
jgi:uncharacterized protein (DUF952 family)